MRRRFLFAMLLPLCGCYEPAQDAGYGYSQPGYPPPGYPPPGYPGGSYPAPGYQPGLPYNPYANAYPGYDYNGGEPTIIVGGVTAPLILFGGEWGYYDRERHWHRAPDAVYRDLNARRPAGAPFHPPAGPPHWANPRPPQAGERPGGPAAYHPPGQGGPAATGPAAAGTRPPQGAPAHPEDHRRDCPPGQRC